MRVIILKPVLKSSGNVHEVGANVDVTLPYGVKLVAQGKAYEIPQFVQGQFNMFGEPSNKRMTLRRPPTGPPVTIEEYKEFVKPIEEKILSRKVRKTKQKEN